jgi:hypothetical protein
VVIPAMLIILGFQLLLSAISEDLRSVPETPLSGPLAENAADTVYVDSHALPVAV